MFVVIITFTARWALKHLFIGLSLWPGPLLALCAGLIFLIVRDMDSRSNRNGSGGGTSLPPRPSSVAPVPDAYAARTESSREE